MNCYYRLTPSTTYLAQLFHILISLANWVTFLIIFGTVLVHSMQANSIVQAFSNSLPSFVKYGDLSISYSSTLLNAATKKPQTYDEQVYDNDEDDSSGTDIIESLLSLEDEDDHDDDDDDDDGVEYESIKVSTRRRRTTMKINKTFSNRQWQYSSNRRNRRRKSSTDEDPESSTSKKKPGCRSRRGVGRQGYNATVLHMCSYETKRYLDINEIESWNIRLDLVNDFFKENGHIDIPFRYSTTVEDYNVNGTISGTYTIHLGRWLHRVRKFYQKDQNNHTKKVKPQFVQQLNSLGMNWDGAGPGRRPRMFQKRCDELVKFRRKFGHMNVPRDSDENRSLGLWIDTQRTLYKKRLQGRKSQLTDQRIQDLLKIGFDFKYQSPVKTSTTTSGIDNNKDRNFSLRSYFDDQWNLMFDLLQKFKDIHGHCNVPPNYDNSDWDFNTSNKQLSLGLWVMDQRRHYMLMNGSKRKRTIGNLLLTFESTMTMQRFDALSDAGFDFEMDSDMILPWDSFQGHIDNAVEFSHSEQLEYDWWTAFYGLCQFLDANGGFDFTSDECLSRDLALWVQQQETSYDQIFSRSTSSIPSLTESHYQALCDVGFLFNSNTTSVSLHNTMSRSPGRKPSVLSLDPSIEKSYETLSDDLKKVVDSFRSKKVVDKTEELAWLVRYQTLRRYYTTKGPGSLSNVNKNDTSDNRLALWAKNQRKQFINYYKGQKSTMTLRRIDMLNAINFDWDEKVKGSEEEWKSMIKELKHFKDKHGHCFVPVAYPFNTNLGEWVHLQRQAYLQLRSNPQYGQKLEASLSLTEDKIEELLSLGLDLTMDNMSFSKIAYDVIWNSRKEELEEYIKKHGNSKLSIDYASDSYHLAIWAQEQRILYLRKMEGIPSQLTERRIHELDLIGFSWFPDDP